MSPAFFFLISLLLVPQNPLISASGAEQLARHQTEHVGDTDLTLQELKSGIFATQKLARGSRPKGAQLEFLVALLESTNQAVAQV